MSLAAALSVACSSKESETDAPPASPAATADARASSPAQTDASTPPPSLKVRQPDAVSYAVPLDAALNSVPAGVRSYLVVRDPEKIRALFSNAVTLLRDPLRTIAAQIEERDPEGDAKAELETFLKDFAAFDGALSASGVDLSKGLLVYEADQQTVVVLAAERPEPVAGLARALGGTDAVKCTATGRVGWVACSGDDAPSGYVPGNAAQALRKELQMALPGVALERGNVLGRLDADGQPVAVTLETAPGLVHASASLQPIATVLGQFAAAGRADALELLAPGSGFLWARMDAEALKAQVADAPLPVRNVVGTLTGEAFFGLLESPAAAALLLGVSDPGPAAGLVSMASLQLDQIPKTLPGGGRIDATIDPVEVAGSKIQTLHVKLEGSPEAATIQKALGLSPEAFLFAAGGYASATWGSDAEVVETLATVARPGPSQAVLDGLPVPLARALAEERVAFVFHASLDGMHAPATLRAFERMLAQVPSDPQNPIEPAVAQRVFSLLGALSSASLWLETPKTPVIHLATRSFGDDTEAGKAATKAMRQVLAGADPEATYGPLADRHASTSLLGPALAVRAGRRPDGALVSVAAVGIAAAVAIPAFLEYIERSKSAASR